MKRESRNSKFGVRSSKFEVCRALRAVPGPPRAETPGANDAEHPRGLAALPIRISSFEFRASPSHAAFTLPELLVSVTLTILVCVLVAEMSTSMLTSVSTASGRMTSTQKLDRIRHLLGDDLARLPRLDDGEKRLLAAGDEEGWRVTLHLPARGDALRREGRAWQVCRYHWIKSKALLMREWLEDGEVSQSEAVLTGVIALHPEWLTQGPLQEQAEPAWDSTALPGLLRLRVTLTDVWEEGRAEDQTAQPHRAREFRMILPVAGGGGGA